MNRVRINGRDFLEINVLGDGRCFSASVLLGIMVNNHYEAFPDDNPLNESDIGQLVEEAVLGVGDWMNENIIKVINNKQTQLTCDFVKAVNSSERSFMLLEENMTGDEKWDRNFATLEKTFDFFNSEDSCSNDPEVISSIINELQQNPHYKIYKNHFLKLCKLLTESNGGSYAYAEPEAGLAQIIVNSIGKNIAIADRNNVIHKVFFVDFNEQNNEETIFVKKLRQAHYHALIPVTPVFIKASSAIPMLTKPVKKNENKKDIPTDLAEIFPMFSGDIIKLALEMNDGDIEETISFLESTVPELRQPQLSIQGPVQKGPKDPSCCALSGDPKCCVISGGKSFVRNNNNKNKKRMSIKKNKKRIQKSKSKKHKKGKVKN